MAQEGFKRKLTAILSADVAGYSRLMGDDEAATVKTLSAYREIMTTLIKQHRGRVVDSPGDNVLAEFASVVDAVQCSVSVQSEFQARNAELPENRRMEFRIGINLGDVIEEGDRIYGDGVNIAARLEALANPGGICISKTALDHIESKLPLGYEFMGDQTVKNIAKPVSAYRVTMDARISGVGKGKKIKRWASGWRGVTLAGAMVVVIAIGGVLVWNAYYRPSFEPASMEKMAFPLPDKPSIAVLPFDNMSGDPEQDYLSDGLTEEIISALSRLPKLFVIARHSTSTYKNKPVKVQQVSEELGVRYVLEGSVRKDQERVRITAQLADATNGRHLWSERYDRDLKDIFALQDEITMKIINALQVELMDGEHARLWGKGTDNLQAYLKSMQASEQFLTQTKEGNEQARRLAKEAISLDPEYAPAYHFLSRTHMMDIFLRMTKSPKQSIKRALELAQKVITLDDSYALGHGWLGFLHTLTRKHEKGIMAAQKGVALDPNGAHNYLYLEWTLRCAGRHEEALQAIEKAIRLNPFPPVTYYRAAGMSYIFARRYEEAIDAGRKAIAVAPNDHNAYMVLSAAYSLAGRDKEASSAAEEVLRINPKVTVKLYGKRLPYKNKSDAEIYLSALRKAGLPDEPPLPLPDKPSIAVLAFENMSGDPEQEFLSDGLSEEIITALSKVENLFVIARNSSFTYKGKPVKVQQVGRELGVKYVLEGSVRKSGDRVRITAQLVDAKTGNHLWAERYDRKLEDIFALQDEITMNIVTALQVNLTAGERLRVLLRNTDNLDAYQKYLKARVHYLRFNPDDNAIARKFYKEAIALDPKFAGAIGDLAWTYLMDIPFGRSKSPKESYERATQLAQRMISLDKSSAGGYITLGYISMKKGQFKEAIAQGEKAVALSPGDSIQIVMLGVFLAGDGRYEEAISLVKKAIRLDPYPLPWYISTLGQCYLHLGRYEEAIEEYKKVLHRNQNNLTARIYITAAYSLLGREEDASASASEVLRINPKFSVNNYTKYLSFKNKKDLEQYTAALRKAGLPE